MEIKKKGARIHQVVRPLSSATGVGPDCCYGLRFERPLGANLVLITNCIFQAMKGLRGFPTLARAIFSALHPLPLGVCSGRTCQPNFAYARAASSR